jgi:cytochrome b involved in lipid metabolism
MGGTESVPVYYGASTSAAYQPQLLGHRSRTVPAPSRLVHQSHRQAAPAPQQQSRPALASSSRSPPRISREELAAHSKSSAGRKWIAVRGIVYDVTNFLAAHPGGQSILMHYLGKDATAAFDGEHSRINPRHYVPVVGTLAA